MANAISNLSIGPSLSQLQSKNAAIANGPLAGLSKKIAIAPLNTPAANLPSGTTAGSVIPKSTYGLIQTPSVPQSTNTGGAATTGGGLVKTPSSTMVSSPTTGTSTGAPAGSSSNPYTYNQSTGWGLNNGGTQTNPTQAPTRGLFSSVATSLANPTQNEMTTKGQEDYNAAVKQLADFRVQEAAAIGAINSDPVSARVMQGRAQAVQLANAQKEAALAQQVTQAQQEVGFGQAQQSLNQSALSTVAGLVKPQVTSYGQTVFEPTSGTFTGGGGNLDPQAAASDLATKVLSGQMTYEQAVSSLGYAGSAGQQFLNNAIKAVNPNFNAPQSTASQAGAAGVIGTLPQLTAANTAAEGIQNQINGLLQSNPQLNQAQLIPANAIQQWLQGKQLGDPQYQTLFNYLTEYANTMAPVLGVGGDPTNFKTEIANSLVNARASGQSITQVLANLSTLATTKIANIRSGATGGGVVNPSTTGGGGGDIYNF